MTNPNPDKDTPKDFLTPGATNAVLMHELFISLQAGGFSPGEALVLLGHMLAAVATGLPDGQ